MSRVPCLIGNKNPESMIDGQELLRLAVVVIGNDGDQNFVLNPTIALWLSKRTPLEVNEFLLKLAQSVLK